MGLSTAIVNIIMFIPILVMYVLWFNIPDFDDVFALRKEVKYLLTFGAIFVILYATIKVTLVVMGNDSNFEYKVQLQLAGILIHHLLMFGIFMVC